MAVRSYTCFICSEEFRRSERLVSDPATVCCSQECGRKRTHIRTRELTIARFPDPAHVQAALDEATTIQGAAQLLGVGRHHLYDAIDHYVDELDLSRIRRGRGRAARPHEAFVLTTPELNAPRPYNQFKKATQDRYYCWECGQLPEWNGKPLTLQMDHRNGNRYDHRLENLRWLCPNCHTQTSTFNGRNTRYDCLAK
jgi:hypothetical protein